MGRPRQWAVHPARALGLVGLAALGGCLGTAHGRTGSLRSEPAVLLAEPVKGEPIDTGHLGFEMDRPADEHWAVATQVTSPDGNSIPVVVAHPESGAQLVVQVSDPVERPERLVDALHRRLSQERMLELSDCRPVPVDSGSEAYGFDFRVRGEARGRVAIIDAGDHVVLIVASWPEKAGRRIVEQIDQVVRSVRASSDADPVVGRPDKA